MHGRIPLNIYSYSADGGKNPTFQEKFVVNLIEGLTEINVIVWNSNTLSADDLIGSGRYVRFPFTKWYF